MKTPGRQAGERAVSKNSSARQSALKAVSRALDNDPWVHSDFRYAPLIGAVPPQEGTTPRGAEWSHTVECLRFGDEPAGLSGVS